MKQESEDLREKFDLIHFGIEWKDGKIIVEAWDFAKFDKYLCMSDRGGLKFNFKKPVYIAADKFNTFRLSKVIDTEIMVFTADFDLDLEVAKMKFLEAMQQGFTNSIPRIEESLAERRKILAVMESMTGRKMQVDGKFDKMVKDQTIYTM